MSVNLLYPRCAGLDVHKESVVAGLMITASNGKVRKFGTTTAGLQALSDWLKSHHMLHRIVSLSKIRYACVVTAFPDVFVDAECYTRHSDVVRNGV